MTAADPVSVVPPPEERNQATEDDLAVAVVLNIHRLTKGATLYDADNQAAIRQLEMTRRAVIAYGKATGVNPKLFFTDKSVFVGGRLLRAGRSVYTVALELGRIMRRFGVDEVAIGYDVPVEDLRMFQDAVRRSLRGGATEADSPAKQPYKRIRLRRGQPPGRRNEDLSPEDMIIRTYATATIVMRRFLEQLQAQKYRMPIGVRRVAQQLAELSAVQNPAFLGTTALYNSKHEHAGRAVNSALLALAMARQLVDDKRLLARVASGALLFDIGVPRVAGMGPLGEGRVGAALPRLIDEQVPEVPASAAATSWASGGFGDASTQHTVLVYEATSIAFPDLAPAPYDGLRAPTIHARIVATARRFCNLLADPDHERSPDQVVSTLLREARNEADRTMVRLLMSALGIITSGSLVKLSSGETAQVVRVSDNPMMFSTPVVKPVLDASGARIARREFIDLAREDGPGAIYITQLVHLGDDSAVEDAPPRPVEEEVPGAQAMPQHQGLGHQGQQDWGQQQSWSQQDWGQQQAASSEPAGTGEQLAGGVYDLSGYDLDDGGVHGIVDEETNDLGDLGGAPTAHVSRFHAQASQPPHHGAPPGYPAQPSHPAQPSYAPGGAARAHAQQAHFTPHPSSEPSYPSQPSYPAHSGRPSQPSYPSQSYPSQPSYPSEASYPSRPSQPSHPAVSLTPAAGLPRGTFPPHSYDGANSQAPPSGPNASGNWSMPPNDPDEDDVPSMVLQAIVDGRQQPSASDDDPATAFMSPERKNELASLFFGRKDGAGVPQRAAPARAANDKATVPHTRRGSSFMDEARAAAISQGTPLPGHGPSPAEIAQARGAVEGPTSSRRRRLPTREWLRNKLTGVRPTSQGSLQKTPLVHLLVYMLDRNLTGTTMLVAEGMKTQFIYFDQGVPAKVRTTGGISPLDRVLLELGLVEEAPLLEALTSISRTGDLMGQHLVAGGHLDEPTLLAALQWQLVRKLEYMLDLPTTTRFAYYDGINMLDDFGGPELTAVDPLMMIMSGIRRLSGTAVIRKTTSRLGNTPLRVRREAEPARLMLRPEERGIIDLLRARPLTLGELLERDDLAPRTVAEHTIYAMIVTRYLKLGERQKEPVGRQTKAIPLLHQQVQSRRTGSQHLDSRGGDDGMPRRGTSSRRAGGLFQGGGAGAAALPRRGTASVAEPVDSPALDRGLPRRGTSSQGPLGGVGRASPPASPTPSPIAVAPARPSAPERGAPERPSQPEAASRPSAPIAAPAVRRAPARPAPSAPKPAASPKPAAAKAAEPAAPPPGSLTVEEVLAKHRRVDDENYFQLMDVGENASPAAIQQAYFALAKRWHPDRIGAHLAEHKPKVAKVFARINEAFQTLSNDQKRQEYIELTKQGGGTARDREILERAMDAGLLFQKAEVLMKKADYDEAERLLHQAMDADPDQPEYRALLAWVQAHRIGQPASDSQRKTHYRRQIAMLDEVIAIDANFGRALFYRAELLKRSGEDDRAYRDYRKVAQLDPRNIDAARAVRLYEKRNEKKQGGLFGRLFKK